MKIVACCVWYDEPVESLQRMIRSIEGIADEAVFLDGAYARFPHSNPVSPREQHEAILDCCADVGIHATVPAGKKWSNQMTKRTNAFRVAEKRVDVFSDYMFVIDADEHVVSHDIDEIRRIMSSGKRPDTGLVSIENVPSDHNQDRVLGTELSSRSTSVSGKKYARFFRSHKRMTVGPRHHWTYSGINESGEKVILKGSTMIKRFKRCVEADMRDLMVIHNETWFRGEDRIGRKHVYGLNRQRFREDL